MPKNCKGNHVEGSWGSRLPNRKKASPNYKDNEGAAMCKANASNEDIDKGTLVLEQGRW